MTPSEWPDSVRTVHRPRRQLRSIVSRSQYTSFQGRVSASAVEGSEGSSRGLSVSCREGVEDSPEGLGEGSWVEGGRGMG